MDVVSLGKRKFQSDDFEGDGAHYAVDHQNQELTAVTELDSVTGLSHLYQLLPSPWPSNADAANCFNSVATMILTLMSNEDLELYRLRTRLHSYQRRSVAAMLLREHGRDQVWGGILCEEMGTGKTLECLALILLTRASLPSVPPEVTYSVMQGEPQRCMHGLSGYSALRTHLPTSP